MINSGMFSAKLYVSIPETVLLSIFEEATMRNLFVYAPHDSATFRQVNMLLRNVNLFSRLVILPPGTQFTATACLDLRSNDIIILVIENDTDIDHLLELSDEYQNFRIILVMPNSDMLSGNKHQLLTPRLLIYLDSNLGGLSQYLNKAFKSFS